MTLFYIIFLGYILGQVYLLVCLARAFTLKKWLLIPAMLILCGVLPIALRFFRIYTFDQDWAWAAAYIWMGFTMFTIGCFACADILMVCQRLLGQHSKSSATTVKRTFLAALGCAILLFCYGVLTAYTPKVVHVPITTNKLAPGTSPIRIAVISDVHIGLFIGPNMLSRMKSLIEAEKPDIILSLGDMIDADVSKRSKDLAILQSLNAPLGKFAVTGNHEAFHNRDAALEFTREAGFTLLQGQVIPVGPITLVGVDDRRFARDRSMETADIPSALDKAKPGPFTLLLNHQPVYPDTTIGRFDLALSGHTHGGQVWPGVLLTKLQYTYPQGMSKMTGTNGTSQLYITDGFGFWGPPVRLLTKSEIVIFEISSDEPDSKSE